MSYVATSLVWAADLKPAVVKLVVLALADWAADDGSRLFPSILAVGQKIGVSRSQAQRLMRGLIAAGLLSVEANASGGAPGTTPHYRLHLDRLALLPRTGCTGTTSSTDAIPTGSADATPTGSAGAMGGVAPMRPLRVAPVHETGSAGATLTGYEPTSKPKHKARKRAMVSETMPDNLLPAWLPIGAWRSYTEARDGQHKPMTLKSQEIALQHLDQWRQQGHDPRVILENSVMNGWQGLFEPKGEQRKTLPVGDDRPAWATRAGFTDRFEAGNSGCFEHNAAAFKDGKRIGVPA